MSINNTNIKGSKSGNIMLPPYSQKYNRIYSRAPRNLQNLNPLVYEKTANGEEMYDVFSRLMKERILFIGEDFTPDLAMCITSQLFWLDLQSSEGEDDDDGFSNSNSISPPPLSSSSPSLSSSSTMKEEEDTKPRQPITILINSCGGDLSSMFTIYDVMQHIKTPIHTYVLGMAASAAAVILSAGAKGCRYALPHSEIMIHQPLAFGIEGQVTDLDLTTKQMKHSKDAMLEILARHTGRTFQEMRKDCERDKWLSAEEALAYGIIDEIKQPNKKIPELITKKKKAVKQ